MSPEHVNEKYVVETLEELKREYCLDYQRDRNYFTVTVSGLDSTIDVVMGEHEPDELYVATDSWYEDIECRYDLRQFLRKLLRGKIYFIIKYYGNWPGGYQRVDLIDGKPKVVDENFDVIVPFWRKPRYQKLTYQAQRRKQTPDN